MEIGSLNDPKSLIPARKYYDNYVSRKVAGDVTDFDVFNYALENSFNVLFEGPTGNGKTSACLAFAALRNMPFYAIQCNGGAEPTQIFGRQVQDAEGHWSFQDGGMTALFRMSHTVEAGCLLLINELNFMPTRIGPAVFSALDVRRTITIVDNHGEVIPAGKILIVADMNPGYAGTANLNHAMRNRFQIKLKVGYDEEVEAKLVVSESLRDVAQKLRVRWEKGDHSTPISTNSLIEFEKLARGISMDFACENFLNMFPTEYRRAVVQVFEFSKPKISVELGLVLPTPPPPPPTDGPVAPPPYPGNVGRQDMSTGDFIRYRREGILPKANFFIPSREAGWGQIDPTIGTNDWVRGEVALPPFTDIAETKMKELAEGYKDLFIPKDGDNS